MSGWNGGYITDIAYTSGWYRQQSPAILALACLLGGAEARVPEGDDPIHMLELGCGHGYGALLLAASNPSWRITAIDFNPAHIAAARAWAHEAKLDNVTFIEADLSSIAEDPIARTIPEADFVTMHGVWTWVAPAVQAGIVRLLRDKVRAGGIVHVSYNALPAWGAKMGLQRLIHDTGRQLANRSDRQVDEGLKTARALAGVEAFHLRQPAATVKMIEALGQMSSPYLAHEFMNANWRPCFLTDVAAAFADARLEWVGSSHLVENFPSLTLTEDQLAIQQRFDDPLVRELIKDTCIDRPLRHDVFVRGARRISSAQRDQTLLDVQLGLNILPRELPLSAAMPAGTAELNRDFYMPVVQAMADGPRQVRDLLRAVSPDGRRGNPAELIGILVGLGFAEPAARPNAEPGAAAARFNQTATRRLMQTEKINRTAAAASLRMGTGVPVNLLELFVLEQHKRGLSDIERLLDMLGPPPDQRDGLRTALGAVFDSRLPALRAAGVY